MHFSSLQLPLAKESYNKALCKPVINSKAAGKRECTKQFDIYIVITKRFNQLESLTVAATKPTKI